MRIIPLDVVVIVVGNDGVAVVTAIVVEAESVINKLQQRFDGFVELESLLVIRCYTYLIFYRYCYSKSSVRPSECPSMTLMYRGHISWVSSTVSKRLISLGSSLLGAPTGKHPKNSGGIELGSLFSTENLQRLQYL